MGEIRRIAIDVHYEALDDREREMLCWAACGLTASKIAERCNLSAYYVNDLLKRARQKLGALNTTDASHLARAFGEISTGEYLHYRTMVYGEETESPQT